MFFKSFLEKNKLNVKIKIRVLKFTVKTYE